MKSTHPDPEPEVTANLIAEASAWLAILHGPNRTHTAEKGFAQWMKKSPGHARAFEEATSIWEEASGLASRSLPARRLREEPAFRPRLLRYAAGVAVLSLAVVAGVLYVREAGVRTDIGEQRLLALEDGTRVILNTHTRVVVSYSRAARQIELKDGEALFEVARQPNRPFIVTAGDRRIEALGTSFSVRRENHEVAITLVDGKVAVSPVAARSTPAEASAASTITLNPGERIVFAEASPARKDHPQLDKLLAWQRREVAFDNVALADAVNEMNRYNRRLLQIVVPEATGVRVTGLFRAGDSLSFARAVAEAYQLDVREEPDRIVLSGSIPAESATAR